MGLDVIQRTGRPRDEDRTMGGGHCDYRWTGSVGVFTALFGADEIPVLIKIAVPAVAVGMAVLLVVAVVQRMRDRKEEDFKEVEY